MSAVQPGLMKLISSDPKKATATRLTVLTVQMKNLSQLSAAKSTEGDKDGL